MILGVLESLPLCSFTWYQWEGVTMRLKIAYLTHLGVYNYMPTITRSRRTRLHVLCAAEVIDGIASVTSC